MSYLPSHPGSMTLLDIFKYHPERAKFVLDFHEHLMRGPSPFSIKERELIYAFGSGVNGAEEIVREAGARLPKLSYKGTADALAAMAAKSV